MKRPLILLAVPLLTFCAGAQADFYSHRYAGVGYSNVELQGFCSGANRFVRNINSGQGATAGNCSDSGNGWKLYAGWRWSPYLAVEASYQQLANAELDFRLDSDRGEYLVFNDKIDTQLVNAFIVGHWPLASGFSLFAKLGGGLWNSDLSERQAGELLFLYPVDDTLFEERLTAVRGKAGDSNNGTHWGYGAGISYRYHNRWTLRAEWETFRDVGSDDFRSAFDVETASLGWSMHF